MDFIDEIRAFSARIPEMLPHIQNEAITRTALVEPFLRILGYDTANPAEVVPEFGANLDLPGVAKDKKVDYGILRDGQPIILIEVKAYGKDPSVGIAQLYDYFNKVDARFAIATNGVVYRFYTDLEKTHLLDKSPFLEIDLLNLNENLIDELKKLSKSNFDIDSMISVAEELKFVGGIVKLLTNQLKTTDEAFAEYFFRQLCEDRRFAGEIRQQFTVFTQKALKQFITKEIQKRLNASTDDNIIISTETEEISSSTSEGIPEKDKKKIETTEEEIEAFYIIKSILREAIEPNRISYKDTVSYCNVLLDGKTTKPICRFHFNNPQKKRLEIFQMEDRSRKGEKIAIENLDEIYQQAGAIKAIVDCYNSLQPNQ